MNRSSVFIIGHSRMSDNATFRKRQELLLTPWPTFCHEGADVLETGGAQILVDQQHCRFPHHPGVLAGALDVLPHDGQVVPPVCLGLRLVHLGSHMMMFNTCLTALSLPNHLILLLERVIT